MVRVLGGTNVLAVSAPVTPDVVRIDLSAEGYEPASAWLAVDDGTPDSEYVRRAIDALLEGRSVDFVGPHPIARASWHGELPSEVTLPPPTAAVVELEPEPKPDPELKGPIARPRKQRIAGWSLFSVGLASMGTSVGLHVWRGELGDRFIETPTNLNAAQQWSDARIGVWTTAAFGGAATSAATPLLLPDYKRTPWWAWTLGVAGLGLTGYAIYEGVTLTTCPEPYVADESAVRSCVARGQEAGRLALALAGAAPLLSVPLVYLFRPLRAEPSVSVTREGAVVRVRKTF